MAENGNGGNVPQRFATCQDGTFCLNNNVLEKILLDHKLGDIKIYVVSIIGPLRSGKSFILNLFVKYLQKGATNNGFGDRNESLSGFEWKSGSVGVTKGMWMWPEVFLLDTGSGEKVGVVLVDTQGAFDKNCSKAEDALLFSVTALTSSVLIYNLHRSIDEEKLEHILEFLMCMNDEFMPSVNTKLEKCLFLVRDWEFVDEHASGIEGGKAFLEKTLHDYNKSNDNANYARQYIEGIFKDIACFLMTHPGRKAPRQKFDGKLADLDETFVDDVQNLATYLFGQKDVHSGRLTCQELFQLYTSYDGKKITNVKDFLTITLDLKLSEISETASQLYSSGLTSSDMSMIVSEHEDNWPKALVYFNEQALNLKVEKMETAEFFRNKLSKDVADILFKKLLTLAEVKYMKMFDIKEHSFEISATGTEYLEHLVKNIVQTKEFIESSMNMVSKVGEPDQYKNVYSELDKIVKEIVGEKLKNSVLDEYKTHLNTALAAPHMKIQKLSSTHREVLQKYQETLRKLKWSWMEEMFSCWMEEINVIYCKQLLHVIITDYEHTIRSSINLDYLPHLHNEIQIGLKMKFLEAFSDKSEGAADVYLSKLEKEINVIYCKYLLDVIITEYEHIIGRSTNLNHLALHNKTQSNLKMKFLVAVSDKSEGPADVYLSKLEKKINVIYCKHLLHVIIKEYEWTIRRSTILDNLSDLHNRTQNCLKKKLLEAVCDKSEGAADDYVSKLEKEINVIYGKHLLQLSITEYERIIRENTHLDYLSEIHKETYINLKMKFQKAMRDTCEGAAGDYVSKLEKEINVIYGKHLLQLSITEYERIIRENTHLDYLSEIHKETYINLKMKFQKAMRDTCEGAAGDYVSKLEKEINVIYCKHFLHLTIKKYEGTIRTCSNLDDLRDLHLETQNYLKDKLLEAVPDKSEGAADMYVSKLEKKIKAKLKDVVLEKVIAVHKKNLEEKISYLWLALGWTEIETFNAVKDEILKDLNRLLPDIPQNELADCHRVAIEEINVIYCKYLLDVIITEYEHIIGRSTDLNHLASLHNKTQSNLKMKFLVAVSDKSEGPADVYLRKLEKKINVIYCKHLLHFIIKEYEWTIRRSTNLDYLSDLHNRTQNCLKEKLLEAVCDKSEGAAEDYVSKLDKEINVIYGKHLLQLSITEYERIIREYTHLDYLIEIHKVTYINLKRKFQKAMCDTSEGDADDYVSKLEKEINVIYGKHLLQLSITEYERIIREYTHLDYLIEIHKVTYINLKRKFQKAMCDTSEGDADDYVSKLEKEINVIYGKHLLQLSITEYERIIREYTHLDYLIEIHKVTYINLKRKFQKAMCDTSEGDADDYVSKLEKEINVIYGKHLLQLSITEYERIIREYTHLDYLIEIHKVTYINLKRKFQKAMCDTSEGDADDYVSKLEKEINVIYGKHLLQLSITEYERIIREYTHLDYLIEIHKVTYINLKRKFQKAMCDTSEGDADDYVSKLEKEINVIYGKHLLQLSITEYERIIREYTHLDYLIEIHKVTYINLKRKFQKAMCDTSEGDADDYVSKLEKGINVIYCKHFLHLTVKKYECTIRTCSNLDNLRDLHIETQNSLKKKLLEAVPDKSEGAADIYVSKLEKKIKAKLKDVVLEKVIAVHKKNLEEKISYLWLALGWTEIETFNAVKDEILKDLKRLLPVIPQNEVADCHRVAVEAVQETYDNYRKFGAKVRNAAVTAGTVGTGIAGVATGGAAGAVVAAGSAFTTVYRWWKKKQ